MGERRDPLEVGVGEAALPSVEKVVQREGVGEGGG